jgi:hypothetical protein
MLELVKKVFRRLYAWTIPQRRSTSLSDNQAYPQVCMRAALDYRRFNVFRRNPIYNQILEHVTESLGREYLELVRRDPAIAARLDEFKQNDLHGGPRTFVYPGVGRISPSTLRYVKVLADLKAHFGTLDGLRICEIGVGYGGQCRILNAFYTPKSYRLVDITAALWLAKRFLEHYAITSTLTFTTMNELEPAEYDLVISNYAFAELPGHVQDVYLDRVIARSQRGYMTYNEITPAEFHTYATDAVIAKIRGAVRLPETPLTHPANSIIVWGHGA